MMAAKRETLLIELRTEELPPKALAQLGEAFARSVAEGLEKHGLREADAPWRMFATPRRLAVRAEAVASEAASREVTEKFLPVSIAFDEAGKP
ncbi:MAG: glycine--tRNA ligase subunit beta, partial [Rhodocyclaceae bacterium]|nr:glycine--tRNA ligase subunit beta [Rhodocyclaceae bacterium]